MVWDAGLDLLPNQLSPVWQWRAPTSGEQATMDSGVLTIRSASNVSDYVTFAQTGGDLAVPTNLWIEARTRWVSGTDNVPSRSHVCVMFTTTPNVGNSLYIAQDRIFVMTGLWTEGDSASVDTDGAVHTYRIEVEGTAAGSPFRVYYDGTLTLSGMLFSDSTAHGVTPRVYWGDGTKHEGGVSEWEYVAHNASASPGVWFTVRHEPPGARIAWSTAAYGFVLEESTNLLLPSAWQDVTNTPAVVGHEKSVPVTITGNRFFRLKQP